MPRMTRRRAKIIDSESDDSPATTTRIKPEASECPASRNSSPLSPPPASVNSSTYPSNNEEYGSTSDIPISTRFEATTAAMPGIEPKAATEEQEVTAMSATHQDRADEFATETAERRAHYRTVQEANGEHQNDAETHPTKIKIKSGTNSDNDLTHKSTPPTSPDSTQGQHMIEKSAGDSAKRATEQIAAAADSSGGPKGEEQGGSALSRGDEKFVDLVQKQALSGSIIITEEAAKALDSEEESKPKVPTLGQQVYDAVAKGTTKAFSKGDVGVIIDPNDLSKTLLLSSGQLFHASTKLAAEVTTFPNKGTTDVKFVFLLKADEEVSNMPALVRLNPMQSIKEFCELECESYAHASDATKNASNSKRIVEPAIKKEDEEEQIESSEQTGLPQTDWIEAYETFFSIIAGMPQRRINNSLTEHAEPALPQIEGIVTIAQYLNALPVLDNTFNSLLLSFISNQSLWTAIAKEAASWLLIGIAMKNSSVYEEALRHVIGCYPEWPWTKSRAHIPENVIKIVESKSAALELLHSQTSLELSFTTLIEGAPGNETETLVNKNTSPTKWQVVNIWRDWVGEHLAYMNEEQNNDAANKANPTWLCKHKGECLTVAGFYRTLSKGGDAYLPADEVVKLWKDERSPKTD